MRCTSVHPGLPVSLLSVLQLLMSNSPSPSVYVVEADLAASVCSLSPRRRHLQEKTTLSVSVSPHIALNENTPSAVHRRTPACHSCTGRSVGGSLVPSLSLRGLFIITVISPSCQCVCEQHEEQVHCGALCHCQVSQLPSTTHPGNIRCANNLKTQAPQWRRSSFQAVLNSE